MLDPVNRLAELFLQGISGLLTFLGEAAYRLARLLFSASPFLLLIAISAVVGGLRGFLFGTGLAAILLLLGIAWATRRDLGRGELDTSVITMILISNLVLISGLVFVLYDDGRIPNTWLSSIGLGHETDNLAIEPGTVEGDSSSEEGQLQEDAREKKTRSFVASLGRALGIVNGLRPSPEVFDFGRVDHVLAELRDMKELKAIPSDYLLTVLQACRGTVDRDSDNQSRQNCRRISLLLLKLAVETDAKDLCGFLYEIQAYEGFLELPSREASGKVCGV